MQNGAKILNVRTHFLYKFIYKIYGQSLEIFVRSFLSIYLCILFPLSYFFYSLFPFPSISFSLSLCISLFLPLSLSLSLYIYIYIYIYIYVYIHTQYIHRVSNWCIHSSKRYFSARNETEIQFLLRMIQKALGKLSSAFTVPQVTWRWNYHSMNKFEVWLLRFHITFNHRWIEGRGSVTDFPPRSPDLAL